LHQFKHYVYGDSVVKMILQTEKRCIVIHNIKNTWYKIR